MPKDSNVVHIDEQKIKETKRGDIQEQLYDGAFKVTIFGSARTKPEDPIYQEINKLAGMIALEGYDLVTGGGPGIMTAAAEGHRAVCDENEQDLDTIGINIKLPFEQMPNKHMNVLDTHETFSTRLDTFMLLSNIVVVAPGGIGTTLELFYTWQLMQVGHICKTPIIVYGDMWETLVAWVDEYIIEGGYANREDLDLIVNVHDNKTAMKVINTAYEFFESKGKDACINIHKYIAALKQLNLDQGYSD